MVQLVVMVNNHHMDNNNHHMVNNHHMDNNHLQDQVDMVNIHQAHMVLKDQNIIMVQKDMVIKDTIPVQDIHPKDLELAQDQDMVKDMLNKDLEDMDNNNVYLILPMNMD